MTPELYERLCQLFDQAQTLPGDDRLAFLAEVGAAEPELRGELERLLAQDEQARRDGLLQQPCPLNARILLPNSTPPTLPPEQAEAQSADELVGRKVGPYVIEERIGTGGMGTVYRAVRQEGYHQWVAVKVIRPGLDSAEALRRFETERQVLADLPHPHIARLLDGGTLGDGRPYLVMEYIDGEPLDRYCDSRQLGTRQRVELLLLVCAAVQHAHQRGVIHRDLKPANVLVTADGTPRVTDFGLARRLESSERHTATGAILGTPSYMAPEQASGVCKQLGPAADVYALGAILYELLTGRPPFWADTLWEALRQVLNEEPVPPGRLHPGLPRDLETICLKCLHKQAACRYQSAETLADDLKRWLSNKPIAARPASRLERAVKWARRRPTVASLLGVSVLAGLALAVLSVVAVWGWRSAVAAMQQREQERQQKEQEQAKRARAQVRALLSANPQAVLGILDSLAEQRHEVLPSLRAAWQEPDTPLNRRRRMRAALALLEVEPDLVRGELVKWMLEVADPAELIVVRAALQPHAARLRSDLWRQLQAAKVQPDRRLRLLAALAAFDPLGAGWKTVDEKALQPWLADNPLYLGGWTTAFRPAREHLLGPLSKVFRTATPEGRAAAASILADYAGDRPRMLVELIVEADDRQFATLLAVLGRHRQEAIGLLTRELDRKAEANWEDQPPRPSWVEPSAAARKQIEQADGMLAKRFALVQTLPLEQFRALAKSLSGSGYRPVRFRPYPVGKSIQVAAVWTRDGRDWRLLQGVRAELIRQQDEALRRHGYQPVDVSGWLSPIEPGMERYAGLWAQAPSKQEARLYVGVAQQRDEQDGRGPLEKAGLVPLTFQALLAPDGTRRFSSVWSRLSPVPVWRAKFWADQPTYEGELTPDRVQLDIAVRRAPKRQTLQVARAWLERFPAEREYSGVWHNAVNRESVELHGLRCAEHLARWRLLADQDYRPAALGVAETRPGEALVTASVWQRPSITEAARENLARRQAGAALALARLDEVERIWPLLKHSAYPEARSRLVQRLCPNGVLAQTLAARLDVEQDASVRRALILALGEYSGEQMPGELLQRLVPKLLRWYRDDPDPGIHGAIDWLLRHGKEGATPRPLDWGQARALAQVDRKLKRRDPDGKRGWYVNGQGQTLVVVDARQPFLMGSPGEQAGRYQFENLHWRRIGRRYAIGTKPVTVAQWQHFLEERPDVQHVNVSRWSPEPGCPIGSVTWYMAAAYCNWLSEKEGIAHKEWCYPEKIGAGMKPFGDYLKRKGYRLPTEAEWEFACRAGARTSRPYGSALELLPRYTGSNGNALDRTWPVGQKRPNDLGLFDMHGNVWQWCQESYQEYAPGSAERPAKDEEDTRDIQDILSRVMRGPSIDTRPPAMRTACRAGQRPTGRIGTVGLRVARTCD
jgi:formylglycine-generating enzyme required for sulfatase activity